VEDETNRDPVFRQPLTGNALVGRDDGRICKDHRENKQAEKHGAVLWAFIKCYKAVKKD